MWFLLSKVLRVTKRVKQKIYDKNRKRLIKKNIPYINETKNRCLARNVFPENFFSDLIISIGHDKITSIANEQIDNKYRVFGYDAIDFKTYKSLWYSDCINGYTWPSNKYFRDTELRPENVCDIKVPWESARLHHLCNYGLAYSITADEKYVLAGNEYLKNFIENNPFEQGINWFYSMEVSIRLINIILYADLIERMGRKLPEQADLYMKGSIKHIMSNIEWRGGIRNNHYFVSLFGLNFASFRFSENSYYKQIFKFSSKEIILETKFHILPDGGGAELSSGYHQLNMEALYLFYSVNKCTQNVKETLYGKLSFIFRHLMCPIELKLRRASSADTIAANDLYHKGMHFLSSISNENGQHPLIGDNDSGKIIKVSPLGAEGRVSWANSLHFLNKKIKMKQKESITETLSNVADLSRLESFSLPSFEIIGELRGCKFDDFGLITIQSDNILFTLKLHVDSKIPGHKHDDSLSISLSYNAEWLFRDNGTYSYNVCRESYFNNKKKQSHTCSNVGEHHANDFSLEKNFNGYVIKYKGNTVYLFLIKNKMLRIYKDHNIKIVSGVYYPDYFVAGVKIY
jgi:hypothetical protein